MGEHVDGLNGNDAVVAIHIVKIACLSGRIATDIDNAGWGST